MMAPETSSISATKALTARAVTLALSAVCILLILADQLGGYFLDRVFESSSYNPVAGILATNADVIIAGASGSRYSMDPSILGSSVYNAASDGQSGFYVAALLRAIPAGSVKRVIYGFNPSDVLSGLDNPNVKQMVRYAPWSSEDVEMLGWISGGSLVSRVKLFSGFYRYHSIGHKVIYQWLRPRWSNHGFEPLFRNLSDDKGKNPIRIERSPQPPTESGLHLLESVRDAVQKQDAELIVVITPAYGYDRRSVGEHAQALAAMRETFSGLKMCDLTQLPASNLAPIFMDRTNFSDSSHMNHHGAQAYSTYLRDVIGTKCDF